MKLQPGMRVYNKKYGKKYPAILLQEVPETDPNEGPGWIIEKTGYEGFWYTKNIISFPIENNDEGVSLLNKGEVL